MCNLGPAYLMLSMAHSATSVLFLHPCDVTLRRREDGVESLFEIGTWWVMWAKYRLASSCGEMFGLSQWPQEASEPQRT